MTVGTARADTDAPVVAPADAAAPSAEAARTAIRKARGALAVGDLDGYVHFLSRSDGSLMARLSVGGGAIVSPPQTTSQGVLVQTGNGNLVLIGAN